MRAMAREQLVWHGYTNTLTSRAIQVLSCGWRKVGLRRELTSVSVDGDGVGRLSGGWVGAV